MPEVSSNEELHLGEVCPRNLVCDEEDRDDLLLPDLQVCKGSKWIQVSATSKATFHWRHPWHRPRVYLHWGAFNPMVAKFPLNPLGSSSYIVLETDYISSGLLCTCQELNVLSLFYVHRVSCSLLQRKPEEDPALTEKMETVLLSTGLPYASDFASHLSKITHDDHCKYGNTSVAMEI